jgi:hypothetical protein
LPMPANVWSSYKQQGLSAFPTVNALVCIKCGEGANVWSVPREAEGVEC